MSIAVSIQAARFSLCRSSKVAVIPSRYRLDFSTRTTPQKSSGNEKTEFSRSWRLSPWIGGTVGVSITAGYLYYSSRTKGDSFVKYTLVAKEPVSSTASIFHLEPKDGFQSLESIKDIWTQGIWNIHFKQPQLQILRSYTPLPCEAVSTGSENNRLRFLIRQDPRGEVSTYLHRLPLGASMELRGPNLEYSLPDNVRQVIFFVGGTGIAPALQVAHAILSQQKVSSGESKSSARKPKVHILWANRSREDCLGGISDEPPTKAVPSRSAWFGLSSQKKMQPQVAVSAEKGVIVKELEDLKQKHPGQITVEYFVNTEDTWIKEDAVFRALSRFDAEESSGGQEESQGQRHILISGPDGFISYLAGPKEWRGGKEEQGSVSGIIGRTLSKNRHDIKIWKI